MVKKTDKNPYHVDLSELMHLYDTNYIKLNALLPIGATIGEQRCYSVGKTIYHLKVAAVTKYTTLVDIYQRDEISVFPLPQMSVRLYHDVKVAEVCAAQKMQCIQARYDYPNPQMMQRDEKFQRNQFLGEWLTFCLKNGLSKLPINISSDEGKTFSDEGEKKYRLI